jgi:hypothetical protein
MDPRERYKLKNAAKRVLFSVHRAGLRAGVVILPMTTTARFFAGRQRVARLEAEHILRPQRFPSSPDRIDRMAWLERRTGLCGQEDD